MIVERSHEEVISSGNMETAQAQIAVTPEMFSLLSSGIYENKIMAIVRELTCNGRDGQVFADNTEKAMDMHLPNQLEPWWSIRDYGTGLSHEQVMSMYVTYGMSTKGDSNDFIGAMGIGSKSPLSYTDSFMVTSYQGGVERQYNIFMEGGIPQVSKMSERETHEEDGLKVMLQVRSNDYYKFANEAELFLKLFPSPVTVTGASINTEVVIDDNHGYMVVKNYPSGMYALMGGVAYRIEDRYKSGIEGSEYINTMVLPFEIGQLSVAASRETLGMDEKTVAALDKRVENLNNDIRDNIQKEIDNCENIMIALSTAKEKYNFNFNYYGGSNLEWLTYKGKSFKDWKSEYQDNKYKVRVFSPGSYSYSRKGDDDVYKVGELGSFSAYNNRATDNYTILNPDKKIGSIKCAQKHATELGKKVMLISDEALRNEIKDLFNIDVANVSDLYEGYFPKGQTVARQYRKTSGLFEYDGKSHDWKEVTELEIHTEGYFVEVLRKTATIPDVFEGNWHKIKELVDYGVIPKLYLVRKTGRKHLKGVNGLVELTKEVIQLGITKQFNKRVRRKLADYKYSQAYRRPSMNLPEGLLEAVKDEAPVLTRIQSTGGRDNKMYQLNNRYDSLKSISYELAGIEMPPIRDVENRLNKVARAEITALYTKYPLFEAIERQPYYFKEQKFVDELLLYIKSKNT